MTEQESLPSLQGKKCFRSCCPRAVVAPVSPPSLSSHYRLRHDVHDAECGKDSFFFCRAYELYEVTCESSDEGLGVGGQGKQHGGRMMAGKGDESSVIRTGILANSILVSGC